MDKDIKSILDRLPEKFADIIERNIASGRNVTEIRLRAGFPARICIDGKYSEISQLLTSDKDISDIFMSFCDYTLRAYESQIKHGYITVSGGHRIGIGGRYDISEKDVLINDVTSLIIRLNQHTKAEISDDITDFHKGLLIAGRPHSGKTTLIRNICRKLTNHNIVICDERDELYENNLNCDYITGLKKHTAIIHAIRSMNPDIIVCDEIGDENEALQILSGVNSGVKFICSVHADCIDDLYNKPNIKVLLDRNIFDKIVLLSEENNSFIVKEIRNV